MYSKASKSLRLGDTRFFIGSQNTQDTRFLANKVEDAQFLIGSETLEIHSFWPKPWFLVLMLDPFWVCCVGPKILSFTNLSLHTLGFFRFQL